ncbi:MAG TPA: PAS domain S-box protein, partial [Terriglobales bacterium]|nr:PAS domain S-box protein [Terriglobales bacterium]
MRKLEETNIELSVANAALAENEQRLRAVIESEPECVKILARDGTLLEMNPAGLRMIEADSAAQVVGKDIGLLILPQYRRSFRELCEATFLGESGTVEFEIIGFKGTRRWLDTHSVPLRNSLGEIVASLGITRDVTEKKRNVQLLNDQMRLLEMIACGAPLRTTLDAILVAIEAQDDDLLCSILLLDAEGRRFTQCAAPRLPEPYRRYFEGAVVEENAGSCGLAVCRGEQVVVEDIARASLSETWRQIALSHGLRACCSMPIFDSHKQVVGSFAMYFPAPCRPMERQTPLIGIATHVAAIAIGKQREEDALRDSEARFRDMADSAPVMIWITRADGSCTYVNQQWQNFTGQVQEDPLGMGWLEAVHPEDCERVKQEFADANRRRSPIRFECRLRRGDGEYRWVIHSAQPRISELGEFFGYIGSVLDISERKQAEDERQRSLDRVRALHEINLAITSTMNRQSQLDRLLEKIETFFPYPIVSSVRLLRPETGRLECLAQRGVDLRDWLRREPGRTLHRALQVVESKSPMVVGDIQRDALTHDRPMPSSFGLISYAGIPLIARDHVLGVLGVYTKVLHEFTTEEIEFLTALAGQASVAIQNTQLYEETERRRHEAEELAKIARSLTETLNIKAVADRVVNSVLELFNVRGSTLRLRQPDDSLVRLAAAGEVFSQTPIGVVMPGGVGLVGR